MTVFVGENAVGKTNLLEALYLVTACQSFRHATNEQLVFEQADEEKFRVSIDVEDENRTISIECRVEERRRQYRMNGKGRNTSDIRGILPAVIFTPDDLVLVKGSNQERRGALDMLGEQLKSSYQTVRLQYNDVLRQKNKLLKDGYGPDVLAAFNEMMVKTGAQLTFFRASLFDRLAPKIILRYQQLASGKEQLGCVYVPSWIEHGNFSAGSNDAESGFDEDFSVGSQEKQGEYAGFTAEMTEYFTSNTGYFPLRITRDQAREFTRKAIENRLQDECTRQRTIIGPHMDKIYLTLDGKDASIYASQGQQRSIVLAWKLAEVDLIGEMLGQPPILLLDDVMSELDAKRRVALEDCVAGASQAFITTTNLGYFTEDMLMQSKIVSLPIEDEAGFPNTEGFVNY